MAINNVKDYRKHLHKLCKRAYKEGRNHELIHVKLNFPYAYQDTDTFKRIQTILSPKEHLIKLLKAGVNNDKYK